MKWLLWELCPASIQKTTAFVGLVTQKEAFWWTAYRRKHRTQCAAQIPRPQLLCESIPLWKKGNMHMWAVVGLICKQKTTPWQCPVSGWCMRMWLRVNAWTRTQLQRNKTSVTHTHTQSLARTAVADVVRIEHLTLCQCVLNIMLSEKWGIFSALSLPILYIRPS